MKNMSNIFIYLSIFANLVSIVLAMAGLYLVYENWRIWKKIGMDNIKARVFLNKEFLEKNWVYMVTAGGLVMLRRVYRFLELTYGIAVHQDIEVLFDAIGCIVILLLVLIAYQWYKLIHAHI